MNEVFARMKASLKALEGEGDDVLFVSETCRMALDGKRLGAEYPPPSNTYPESDDKPWHRGRSTATLPFSSDCRAHCGCS